ncbi:MAG: LamG-like jellyroll fold domain-containing protein, partial [Planctomycetota bacterium]
MATCSVLFVVALVLFSADTIRAQPRISEFLAWNVGGLDDEDGASPDWIEIYHPGPNTIDLEGWSLTDDPTLQKLWTFPTVTLDPGEYLVVFASGKDRRVSGRELHCDFQLRSRGDYLALVAPDASVAQEFHPVFPAQRRNVSYGIGQERSSLTLLDSGASATFFVPEDNSLGGAWNDSDFDDATWSRGTAPFGFDAGIDVGLISHWPFDGDVEDVVGSSDGVRQGPAFRSDVPPEISAGQCLFFDGTDHVDLSHHTASFAGLDEGSFSAWIRTSGAGTHVIVSASDSTQASNEVRFFLESGGRLKFGVRANGNLVRAESVRTFSDGEWHHVAAVISASGNRLYGDGELLETTYAYGGANSTQFFDDVPNLDRMAIGRNVDSGGPQWHFDGFLDDVAIFAHPLSETEIRQLAFGAPLASIGGFPVSTDLSPVLRDQSSTVYFRYEFDVADASAVDFLRLDVQYDDGFAAWLNGVVVASRNAPLTLRYDSSATQDRPDGDALVPELIALSGAAAALRTGRNVLAIQGLNSSRTDSNYLFATTLEADSVEVGTELGYFPEPSPGEANGVPLRGFVADTQFSVDRGFFDDPFEVEVTSETEGAIVRYTLDGTAPTLSHGATYSAPLSLSRTTTLRAAAFLDDHVPSNVDTQTYIFIETALTQPTLPNGFPRQWSVDSRCSNPPGGGKCTVDYAMDPNVVDSANDRDRMIDALESIPSLSIVAAPEDLFDTETGIYSNSLERGQAWERPGSIEFFDTNDGSLFQYDVGLRMQGGASRRPWTTPKHSFRLLFRSEYGPPRLDYPWFDSDESPGFDTVVVRAGFNDAWTIRARDQREPALYMRDQFVRDSQRAMGQPSASGRFVHLWLNGLYWGLYNPSERPDEDFLSTYLGGDSEDWDVITHIGGELKAGTIDAWSAMFAVAARGLNTPASYDEIRRWLDVESLADYMLLNVYVGTLDWPQNNWYAARKRSDGEGFK